MFAAAGAAAAGSPLRCLGPYSRKETLAGYGSVCALVKDVPDVRGDAVSILRSFSVRLVLRSGFCLQVGPLAVQLDAAGNRSRTPR